MGEASERALPGDKKDSNLRWWHKKKGRGLGGREETRKGGPKKKETAKKELGQKTRRRRGP